VDFDDGGGGGLLGVGEWARRVCCAVVDADADADAMSA